MTATVVLNVWGLWFFCLEDAMNKWIVKNTRERERVCVMVKCKSQSKLCFQNCAGVNYSCPWWFMVSFDVHVGVPNKFYTPVNYEGPRKDQFDLQICLPPNSCWQKRDLSADFLSIYLSSQNSMVSLLSQWTREKWDPVHVFVLFFSLGQHSVTEKHNASLWKRKIKGKI